MGNVSDVHRPSGGIIGLPHARRLRLIAAGGHGFLREFLENLDLLWTLIVAWRHQRHRRSKTARLTTSRCRLKVVQVYDVMTPYRPVTLAMHKDFEPYYKADAPFPANSLETGTEMAEEPPATTPTTKPAS